MEPNNQPPNPAEEYIKSILDDKEPPESEAKASSPSPSEPIQEEQPKQPVQSPITAEAFEKRKPVFDPTGRVEDINASEVKVADIRRHPFGLMIMYTQVIIAVGLIVGFMIFLLPSVIGSSAAVKAMVAFLSLILVILGVVFLFLATRIYWGNQLIVTDINVTQVLQQGLFKRKVSELTMANIEDVTASQNGIFQTMFNFGTLTVETAGEQDNFIFGYCPSPNAYAKAIQDARMAFMQKNGSSHH